MPTRPLDIALFDKGLITSVDPKDLPLESASYSENIDGDAIGGRLQSIRTFIAHSHTGSLSLIQLPTMVQRADALYDIIYSSNDGIHTIQDFYNACLGDSSPLLSTPATTMVKDTFAVHIGTGSTVNDKPKWVGRPNWSMFGGIGIGTYASGGIGGVIDDMFASGYYSGTANAYFYIQVEGSGTTIKWNKDGGTWHTGIAISTYFIQLSDGVTIWFNSNGAHGVNDTWTFPVYAGGNALVGYDAQVKCLSSLYTDNIANTFALKISVGSIVGSSPPIAVSIVRRYKLSVIYDGVQESLLSNDTWTDTYNYHSDAVHGYDSLIISVIAMGGMTYPSTFNRRITGVNIYCAVQTNISSTVFGLYKLVGTIDVTNQRDMSVENQTLIVPIFQSSIGSTLTNISAVDKVGKVIDVNELGATYEINSGFPENSDYNIVNYELSAECAGFLFAGKCYQEKFTKAKFMIFRSKEARFDLFDVVNDTLAIYFIPTSMCGFNGKLYVWNERTTLIINPQGLYIENELMGKGCLSQTSFNVVDIEGFHALTFCDTNNIYITDGSGVKELSMAIKKKSLTSQVSWQDVDFTVNPIVVFDAVKSTILFITSGSGISNVFAYHIYNKRWDYYSDFCGGFSSTCAFMGKDGETYSGIFEQILNNFGGATNRAWKYYSPRFVFDSPSQIKEFTKFYSTVINTVAIQYAIDGGTFKDLSNINEMKDVGGKWERAYVLDIYISANTGDNSVDSYSILYRPMIGIR